MSNIRITIDVHDSDLFPAKECAVRSNVSYSKFLGRALKAGIFILDKIIKGSKIIIQDSDGKMKEIIFEFE